MLTLDDNLIKKIWKLQYIIVWLLMLVTTFMPDGDFSTWLYDFLPPVLFVSTTFPLTSKVVNNYVAFSAIILSCLIFFNNYGYFLEKTKEMVLTESIWSLFKFILSCMFLFLLFVFLYFGYLINIILKPEKLTYGLFLENYVLFGLISPTLNIMFLIFIIFFLFALLIIGDILFGSHR